MDLFGWFWLVVFFTWWFGVSAKGMGRKFMSDLHGPARYFWKQVFGTLFYMCGPSVPLLPSLLYLWHDPRILEREKRLASLWSGP